MLHDLTLAASLFALLCLASRAAAQDPEPPPGADPDHVTWLRDHAVALRSIDPARDDDADLEPLRSKIGDCRVVVLGEETHGDGATFALKVRLIEFLHRAMGFDVVAFESGLLDCAAVDEQLAHRDTPLVEAVEGVFPNWSTTAQVRPLFEYVRASCGSPRPVTLAGFDSQLTSRHSVSYLVRAVRELAPEGTDLGPALQWEQPLAAYLEGKRWAKSKEQAEETEKTTDIPAIVAQLTAARGWIDAHREELAAHASPVAVQRVLRALLGADHQVRLLHASDPSNLGGASAEMMAVAAERDRLMAENLVFLATSLYPDRKIVAWCASMHALHHGVTIEDPGGHGYHPYEGYTTMGEIARATLQEAMYTVLFTAGGGSHGWYYQPQGTPLAAPAHGSFEECCAATGHRFLFVDFRALPEKHWLREPQVMRPLGYQEMRAVWPEQADAVIYIDEMFPATREGLAPAGYRLTVPPD